MIAAGGTGGHLFPAQALAHELIEEGFEVSFAGKGLASNSYLDRTLFSFYEIESITPFGGKKSLAKAPWHIGKGVIQALSLLSSKQIDLVVGFGSFHAFPVMLAAVLKRIPLVLFESNAVMGRVNRFFAKKARGVGIQFQKTQGCCSSNSKMVVFPSRRELLVNSENPYLYFSLDPTKKTLLVFGGSQGAKSINALFLSVASFLSVFAKQWQILHFIGKSEAIEAFEKLYEDLGFAKCVKHFESNMALAWEIATLALCRAGAATVSEQVAYGVPAVYIPYPFATEEHQKKNAQAIVSVGGACYFEETHLDAKEFLVCLESLMQGDTVALRKMKVSLNQYQQIHRPVTLSSLVKECLTKRC
jgi:UDP-N-acetylglucosamine--N-acetylmuramyl-(pentapeptide) pyrophosphoryl-undecaprenol N-acetylglucosamine transferase